jgi:hypothetical protein
VSLAPGIDNLQLTLGLVQLAEGDFKNGWKNLQARWGRIKKFSDTAGALGPQWSGESLAGKIVVIWPEIWLGHGDLILFARYATRLAERAKREDGLIVFSCFDPLYALFARSLVEHCNELSVTAFAKGMELQPQHFLGRKVFQCPLMSLPLLLGDTIPEKFPYLTPNPTKVEFWRRRLASDNNLKVGLSWTGRADHPRNDLRSIKILELANRLKDIPGVSFSSLQLGQPQWSKEAQAAELVDFTSELGSFDDTAALVSNLDLVIGVDAVICHLAGALNIPTWVMVDVNAYWGWGRYEPTTVWYKSVKNLSATTDAPMGRGL